MAVSDGFIMKYSSTLLGMDKALQDHDRTFVNPI